MGPIIQTMQSLNGLQLFIAQGITIIIKCKLTYSRRHTLKARADDGRVSDLRMVTLGVGGVAICSDNDDFCPSASPGQSITAKQLR